MRIIVGLGNPGEQYEESLHNLGFKTVEVLSSTYDIPLSYNKKVPGYVGKGAINNEEVMVVKPSSFVNESGGAVKYLLDYYHFSSLDLIIICDDLDLDVGRIRIRQKGSSGGHKGIDSIIEQVGSPDFLRVRIGIGRPPPGRDAVEYVLKPPGKDKKAVLEKAVERAAESIGAIIKDGAAAAMNIYNRKDGTDEKV